MVLKLLGVETTVKKNCNKDLLKEECGERKREKNWWKKNGKGGAEKKQRWRKEIGGKRDMKNKLKL